MAEDGECSEKDDLHAVQAQPDRPPTEQEQLRVVQPRYHTRLPNQILAGLPNQIWEWLKKQILERLPNQILERTVKK